LSGPAEAGRDTTVPVAYVAVAGNNHVQVIDLESGRTLRKIYAGITPWRLALNGDRLWVQHWYSATTAVVDLRDHEVVQTFAARGPGAFDSTGQHFLTFDWPGTGLDVIDARSLKLQRQEATEVRRAYDVAFDPREKRLYAVQFDPMAQGPRERYGYVLALTIPAGKATPASFPTGASPIRVIAVRSAPFVITADSETNGLSLINDLGDGRAVAACAAPRAILLSPDETRMVVACWRGDGHRKSEIVAFHTDFTVRPWPKIGRETSVEIDGAVVAGALSASALYMVDRAGNRLLELDPQTLAVRRQLATGDVPVDVVVTSVSRAARDRAARKGRSRRRLEAVIEAMRANVRPFRDLSWTEESGQKRVRVSFKPPDSLRMELEDGTVRLAQGGSTAAIDPGKRFWITPRQEVISALYGIGAGDVGAAIRRLAGDVPGSPYLRGGIAVDLVERVHEPEGDSWLVGALAPGQAVSQLWIDAESARPMNLIESFPSFRARGHGASGFAGLIETKFYDFAPRSPLSGRIERTVDGRVQRVQIAEVKVDADLPDQPFSIERLGGIAGPRADGVPTVIADAPYLDAPQAPHPPYTTQPPTSGPRLSMLAEWGVHRTPIPPELSVHNLEHGAVALLYNCPLPCPDLVARLEQFARERDFVLVAPYPWMPHRLALTAWGQLDTMDAFDAARVEAFLDAHGGKNHHADAGAVSLAKQP
jgi:DNA-binding beta-propeller fold protein YncE